MTRTRTAYFPLMVVALMAAACGSEPEKAAAPATPPPPTPKTVAERVARYQECWGYFNTAAYDKFVGCYAPTITAEQMGSGVPPTKGPEATIASAKEQKIAFPDMNGQLQIVLAREGTIVSLSQLRGTNSGPMPGPDGKPMPPTNKPVGFTFGHVVDWDAMGEKATAERAYQDTATMLGQLGVTKMPHREVSVKAAAPAVPTVVTSAGSETEARNLGAFKAQADGFNKHDAKIVESFNGPGALFHDFTAPKDMDAKGNTAMLKNIYKAFPDAKIVVTSLWAAGDYTVAEGTLEGTNKGVAPMMGITRATNKSITVPFLEVTKYDAGKISEDWLLYESMAMARQMGMMK